MEKAREFQKNIYFIDYTKAFDCVNHNKLWKLFLKRWVYHLTCLQRNVYVGQEAAVRTEHRIMDWFKIGKGVRHGCILSPCLINLYAMSIMWNAWLNESQFGIKIARRNINNLQYADDTTLMAESEEELKSFLMRMKEENENAVFKLNIKKKSQWSWHPVPIISWQIEGEKVKSVTDFIFLGWKITADGVCSHEIKRCLLLGRKAMTNLGSVLESRDFTLPTKAYIVSALVFPLVM